MKVTKSNTDLKVIKFQTATHYGFFEILSTGKVNAYINRNPTADELLNW